MKNLLKFIKKVFIKVESVFYVGATDILKEPSYNIFLVKVL